MNRKSFERRIYFAGFVIAIASILFIMRFAGLHFSSRIKVASGERLEYHRGYILDRNGRYCALSIERKSLFANPAEINDPEKTAAILAPLVGRSQGAILSSLKKNKRFVWIKRKLSPGKHRIISNLGIKGLHFRSEYCRVYPHGPLASNIIGFVGIDNNGLEGIEYAFDRELSGIDDQYKHFSKGLKHGLTVRLTLDLPLQYIVEKELINAVKRHGAKQAVAVIMEKESGRILAYARAPGYDPNSYADFGPFERRNSLYIDSFEPGSTMKAMTMAALIENCPDVFANTYDCKGSIDIADATINCTGKHGKVDMYDSLKYSCNVGVISAVKSLGQRDLYRTLRLLGFGQKTGLELPGESPGILRSVEQWSGLSKYSISIGYEISVNAIQLVSAFSAIANEGVYVRPTIIESIETIDGSQVQAFYPRTKGRVMEKRTAKTILKMMEGVVSGGTGKKARLADYKVVGKTGTSNKYSIQGGQYSERVISSFIGIAPAGKPDVCILVVVDDPSDRSSGGQAAAPVFGAIASRILPILGSDASLVDSRLPLQKKVTIKYDKTSMPEFRGRGLGEALYTLRLMQRDFGINFTLSGAGLIRKQNPGPGVQLKPGMNIHLEFGGE